MRLTREWLESADACSDAVEEFMAAFPDGAGLTRELLDHETVRHQSDWLADHLPLSATAWAAYDAARATAMAAYHAVRAPAWAAYQAVRATAWAAYDAARAPALWSAYDAVRATALAAYDAVRATAWAAYDAATAPALWSAIVASGLNEPKGDTE